MVTNSAGGDQEQQFANFFKTVPDRLTFRKRNKKKKYMLFTSIVDTHGNDVLLSFRESLGLRIS